MPLISADDVRAEIAGLSADDDAELELLIAEADTLAARWCLWPTPDGATAPTFDASTHTIYLDGPDRDRCERLTLPLRDLLTVEEIADDPDRVYASGDVVNPSECDVDLRLGRVWLKTTSTHAWSRAWRAIRVEVTAGFEAAPDDLRKALILLVGALWQRRHLEGVTNAAEVEAAPLFGEDVRRLLGPYRYLWRAALG